jgi:hypothetical protein
MDIGCSKIRVRQNVFFPHRYMDDVLEELDRARNTEGREIGPAPEPYQTRQQSFRARQAVYSKP